MNKTLSIYAHPIGWTLQSTFSVKIFNALKDLNNIMCIKLDDHGHFDYYVQKTYLNEADNVILLFPIHFFNIPWNLVKYFSDVLENGGTFHNKKVFIICTCYMEQDVFEQKIYGNNLDGFLSNITGLVKYFGGKFIKRWTFYHATDTNLTKLNDFIVQTKQELKQLL